MLIVLSHKYRPAQVVKPIPFEGIVIDDGSPSDIRDLPVGHRVVCGISYSDGGQSFVECANLSEARAIHGQCAKQQGIRGIDWYSAPVADILEEVYQRNFAHRAPLSSLDKLSA